MEKQAERKQEIQKNIKGVLEEIANAQKNSKFNQKVELIGVTKTVEAEDMNTGIEFGLTSIGENKVQEIQRKYDHVEKNVKWHLIGSLQTNKVKYIADKVSMIHSLDRYELAKEIDKQGKKWGRVIPCLIQINISYEESKHGVDFDDAEELIRKIASEFTNVKIVGLMGMAPFSAEDEETRPYFRSLKIKFDDIKALDIKGVHMEEISMGMSGDYTIAIEEGATLVRVGTRIFGAREYN